jgi:RimJ/RimL family protein N-acetyltransferase
MHDVQMLRTDRLLLRSWRPDDRQAFARMNADPEVMEFEIGYRFARHAWGQGYATEAAREAERFAFERAGLVEIVSMTAVGNVRSRAVMNKLGMTHDPDDDFDHPRVPDGRVPDGHPLKRHVLYRMTRERWHAAHIARYG